MLAISQLWRRRHLLASPSEISRLIGPHMENDPNELLLRAHTLLGNSIAREPIIASRASYTRATPLFQKSAIVPKPKRGPVRAGFLAFLLTKTGAAGRFYCDRVLRVVSNKISGRREP
jgi:hypothetical protein